MLFFTTSEFYAQFQVLAIYKFNVTPLRATPQPHPLNIKGIFQRTGANITEIHINHKKSQIAKATLTKKRMDTPHFQISSYITKPQ